MLLLIEMSSLEGLERLLDMSLSNPFKIGWTLELSSSLGLVLLGAYLSSYSSYKVCFLDLLHPDPMISELATECCFIDAAALTVCTAAILITNQHVIFSFKASTLQIFPDIESFASLFILNQVIFSST